jgi:hypothetical protein
VIVVFYVATIIVAFAPLVANDPRDLFVIFVPFVANDPCDLRERRALRGKSLRDLREPSWLPIVTFVA